MGHGSKTSPSPLQKEYRQKIISPGLRFWVIIPIVVMFALFLLVLASFTFITGEFPPVELFLTSTALFLAVVGLALLITRHISRRFEQIIRAAEQVAQGDFSIRINDERRDEIGRMVRAFNRMVADLEHLHKSRDLLSRTMSPAVRQSLIERGLDFRGITQEVSILFVDIRDFTRITERYNPEQLVFFLNDFYTSIANQVHAGGGIIGKYAGDSILAFFGAPEPEPPAKSSTAALLTALALQETIEELSERWTILGLPPIRAGMGMSLGPVVIGPIGSEQQFEFTAIGDAVNLAARLQDLTRNMPGFGIMISAEVYQALEAKIKEQLKVVGLDEYRTFDPQQKSRSPIHFVDLGHVLVKGKKGPVHVYAIPDYEHPEAGARPEQIPLSSYEQL